MARRENRLINGAMVGVLAGVLLLSSTEAGAEQYVPTKNDIKIQVKHFVKSQLRKRILNKLRGVERLTTAPLRHPRIAGRAAATAVVVGVVGAMFPETVGQPLLDTLQTAGTHAAETLRQTGDFLQAHAMNIGTGASGLATGWFWNYLRKPAIGQKFFERGYDAGLENGKRRAKREAEKRKESKDQPLTLKDQP